MTGDVLEPARLLAVGQRNTEPRRRALHRGNAGHDIDGDIGRFAGRDFLGRAAENQRVAALEADDALALFRQAHHQAC